MQPAERTWRPGWPCPAAQVLGPLRHGAGDPTFQRESGTIWRAISTPGGPVTLRLEPAARWVAEYSPVEETHEVPGGRLRVRGFAIMGGVEVRN